MSIKPAAVEERGSFAKRHRYGSQCIVVAIDAKRVAADGTPRWEVYTHGGRKASGLDALEWGRKMEEFGAGEILLTSMDRDGTRGGFDLELTRAFSDALSIPVIASGGVGSLAHIVDGILQGRADAVLAASVFHYGVYTIRQAKEHMDGMDRGQTLGFGLQGFGIRACLASERSEVRAARPGKSLFANPDS